MVKAGSKKHVLAPLTRVRVSSRNIYIRFPILLDLAGHAGLIYDQYFHYTTSI